MDRPHSNQPLRILHLEDEPKDAELIQAALESDGLPCEISSVSTREQFTTALEHAGVDLILSDFSLPGFDGVAALQIAHQIAPSVPFIFVSGTIGEEAAISGVRNGATDYVLKHRLSRLGPAVRRAASEAEELNKRRHAEAALRKSEEQLRHAQKMDAVGRLAGGVAHDFNNMLTVILGYSQLMRTNMASDDPYRNDLEEIERAALRSAELTRQLLAFSRQQVLAPKVMSLNTVITEMDKMLQRLIGEHIDLATAPTVDLGSIKADPGQIEQVIMNLAVNARDAMPDGGKLTIETANMDFDESYAGQHFGILPGRYIMLAVSDSGCGMSVETKSRIFEPFFTTKEVGKGTGLGLSTVYGIVNQTGGHIEVYSELGRGTTFKIYLPRVDEPCDAGAEPDFRRRATGGSETILLAEDDDLVRKFVRHALEGSGYYVIEARDGQEAIEHCEAHHIDMLITDIVMPRMSGPELVERLEAHQPMMPVLYVSGYTDRAMVHQGVVGPGRAFLQKPFTPEALLHKVRDTIDQRDLKAA
jgi:two-component system, cell cycle sensor histidine kinase and response regulator CckA